MIREEKKYNMKKAISLIVALTMIFCMVVPAMAADGEVFVDVLTESNVWKQCSCVWQATSIYSQSGRKV